VAGAADVAGAAGFERLVGADPIAELMSAARARYQRLAELIVETFGGEIALLVSDPSCNRKCGATMNFGMRTPFVSRL